jgi:hypothetical protein
LSERRNANLRAEPPVSATLQTFLDALPLTRGKSLAVAAAWSSNAAGLPTPPPPSVRSIETSAADTNFKFDMGSNRNGRNTTTNRFIAQHCVVWPAIARSRCRGVEFEQAKCLEDQLAPLLSWFCLPLLEEN